MENRWVINHIQKLLTQAYYLFLREILEKIFITKKFTQCKTSHTLKIDVFELLDNKDIGKLFSKHERFSWIKLILVMINLKYWYYNKSSLKLPCLPHYFCQIAPWPTESRLQYNSHHVLHRFPNFVQPNLTALHKY